MIYGRVKWFNGEKGYGFISINDQEDAFVHFTDIRKEGFRDLNDGQLVGFNLYRSSNGFVAEDVVPYNPEEKVKKKKHKKHKNQRDRVKAQAAFSNTLGDYWNN